MADGKSLDDLRREVDAIDDALHDLLMRRAGVTDAIAHTKPRTEGHIALKLAMRPAREAEIMRRLIARHAGGPPIATIIRVVREVLAASLAAQVPFRVHVFAGEPAFADLAHAYFGVGAPLTRYESVSRAVHAVAEDSNSLGVVPLPEAEGGQWWAELAPAGRDGPRVIAKLPFLAGEKIAGPAAYAIAAIEQEPTGDDTTLLLAEVAPSLSRTRLQSQLKESGIVVRPAAGGSSQHRAHLLEAQGFVARNDPRLAAFCVAAGDAVARIVPVGGFANPVTLKAKELVR